MEADNNILDTGCPAVTQRLAKSSINGVTRIFLGKIDIYLTYLLATRGLYRGLNGVFPVDGLRYFNV
jgi:hypothetical protein